MFAVLYFLENGFISYLLVFRQIVYVEFRIKKKGGKKRVQMNFNYIYYKQDLVLYHGCFMSGFIPERIFIAK